MNKSIDFCLKNLGLVWSQLKKPKESRNLKIFWSDDIPIMTYTMEYVSQSKIEHNVLILNRDEFVNINDLLIWLSNQPTQQGSFEPYGTPDWTLMQYKRCMEAAYNRLKVVYHTVNLRQIDYIVNYCYNSQQNSWDSETIEKAFKEYQTYAKN